jgi:paraquat-inducible protein B
VKSLNATLATLDTTLADVSQLSHHLSDKTAPRIDRVLDELGGPNGVVASARRAIDALGDFGREATRSSSELGTTIRDLGDAARAVRTLAQEIEREPDILVKGRGRR